MLSAGGIIDGSVDTGTTGDVGAGFVGSLSGTMLALYETGRRPFLLASLTFGGSRTSAVSDDNRRHSWTAFDTRVGLMVGKTIAERFVPFATGRVFMGPVSWQLGGESVTGGDVHKYTAGAGATVRVPGVMSLFCEVLPIGEQSISAGVTIPL